MCCSLSTLLRRAHFLIALLIVSSPRASMAQTNLSYNGIGRPDSRAQWEWMRLHDPATGTIPGNIRELELSYARTLPTVESLHMAKSQNGKNSSGITVSSWTSRGPFNVGGRTRAFALDIANENILLAGGVSGGVWRSADAGATWAKATPDSVLQSVSCIAQDRRSGKTNTWYYGTGELVGPSASAPGALYTGDGIFKSTDDGVTWAQLASTSNGTVFWDQPFKFVWNIVTNPANTSQDEVLAATFGEILRSTDGGDSWSTVLGSFSNSSSRYTDIAVTSSGVFYVTMSEGSNFADSSSAARGIYRSTDGVNWTNITPAGWPLKYNRIVIGNAPSNENIIYFVGETPGSGLKTSDSKSDDWSSFWKYTYVSGDGSGSGGTWEDRSLNLPHYGSPVGDFTTQGSYDLVIRVKPDDPNTVFIGGTNLYRSTSAFADTSHTAWIGGYATTNDVSQYPNHHPDQHALFFSSSNSSILYSGSDGGIKKTMNALAATVVWTPLDHGYYTSQFYSIAVDHATPGNPVIIGGLQDNGTWFTNAVSASAPWASILGGDGTVAAIANGRTSYYASAQNANIVRFILDSNGNFINGARITPRGGSDFLFVAPYLLDPNNTNMMYLADGGVVWRNTDLTGIPLGADTDAVANWDTLPNTRVSNQVISALGISQSPANRLYYGTNRGALYRVDNVNVGSPTVALITGSNFPPSGYINCIAVDRQNADNVLVVFSNYRILSLFSTSDGGASWSSVGGNLEQNPDGSGNGPSCRWAAILNSTPSPLYYVGTSIGLFSTSALNGASTVWAQEGANTIGNVVVDAIDTRDADGLVVAGTHGNGAFSTNVGSGGTTTTLTYDNGGTPQNGVYEQPPNNGWIIANRMTAPTKNVTITKLEYYYLRDVGSGDGSFFPVVYAGDSAHPGRPAATPLFTGASYTPVTGWNFVDISGANLSLASTPGVDFFVGVKYDGANQPLIGNDTVSNGRAWEFDPTRSAWIAFDSMNVVFRATLYIRAEVTTTTGVETLAGSLPKEFSLAQNYPNPFNPSTIIRFTLPRESHVTLKIYNVLGAEVATLMDDARPAGWYSARWNAGGFASGVYFYRLTGESFAQTRKLMLIR